METVTPQEVWNCRIDSSGRIVLPKSVRTERNWNHGDQVALCRVGDEILLQRSDEMLAAMLSAFRAKIPDGVDLVEELIAERRAEAAREDSH